MLKRFPVLAYLLIAVLTVLTVGTVVRADFWEILLGDRYFMGKLKATTIDSVGNQTVGGTLIVTSNITGNEIYANRITSTSLLNANRISTTVTALKFSDYQFIPIDAGIDGTTAPVAAIITTSTNKVMVRIFSGSADNDLFFTWHPPSDWDASAIFFRVIGFITNGVAPTNGQTVIFKLSGASVADSSLLSTDLGSQVSSTFTSDATYQYLDKWSTSWSSSVALAKTATGSTVLLNLSRDTTGTYLQTTGVLGVEIKFKRVLGE